MTAYTEVLVGTDGSKTAERAVEAAARMAAALGTRLTVATSWRRDPPDGPARSEEADYPGGGASGAEAMWATSTVADGAAIARRAGCRDVGTETPEGGAADALLRLGDARPGALVVVGTVGLDHRAERLLGNVPHQLTHHAHRDLLLVRTDERDHEWKRIGLATDGSATAALAAEHGVEVARALGVPPVLVTVARDAASGHAVLERAAAHAPELEGAEQIVVEGRRVADALVAAAGGFDLFVLGNKGMSGPSRLLGSIANRVTHEVPTDLLLVNTTR